MADLLRTERNGEHRYRIIATDRGFLVSMRTSRGSGVWIVSEWLHRNREAADACLDAVMAFNAAWQAIEAGLPSDALLRRAESLSSAHSRLCEQFDDRPLVGQEVKALRGASEMDDLHEGSG